MYIAQWADGDVGDAGDDYAGCDSSLNLGFEYNSTTVDARYAAKGLSVPAVGYAFLQGGSHYTGNLSDSAVINFRWRKGYKYWHETPLTVFDYFAPNADTSMIDPDDGVYDGTKQWYNLMRGCLPRPEYPAGILFCAKSSYASGHGIVTPYCLSGDPKTAQGWIDGIDFPTGDRRILSIHGPITLNLHDTAEVVIALINGMGADNISSVGVLRYNLTYAKASYDDQCIVTGVEQEELPNSFVVSQNFPNPFNPSTTILYQLPATSTVSIKIYNVLGQEVKTLVHKIQNAGPQAAVWNSRNNTGQSVSSGVYFYRIDVIPIAEKGNSFSDAKKMVLMK